MHTTNYINTFIEIAEDSPSQHAEIPPIKQEKTVATMQFELIHDHPYKFTSDDVVFGVHAQKNGVRKTDLQSERNTFFSKGQPCLRSSPLTKRYGWGIHHNEEGRIALYAAESKEYKTFASDPSLKHVKAMRSKKA